MQNYNKENYDVFYTASNDSDDSSELSSDASSELNTELDVEKITDSNATLVPHCSQEEIAENNSVSR